MLQLWACNTTQQLDYLCGRAGDWRECVCLDGQGWYRLIAPNCVLVGSWYPSSSQGGLGWYWSGSFAGLLLGILVPGYLGQHLKGVEGYVEGSRGRGVEG